MVDLTARLDPAQQTMTGLHAQFADTALASVAGNVDTAKQRLTFADQNITNARTLVAGPPDRQAGLVDAIRAAESALGQARTLLDADRQRLHRHQPRGRRSACGDRRHPGGHQPGRRSARAGQRPRTPPSSARPGTRPSKAVSNAQSTGSADPLGAFTQLTKADAELDRLLATISEEREAAERLSRAFDQALFTAQSRVRAVSDYIDTRRGSIGPEARTRLSEAVRQLEAAQAKRATNLSEAIAHANGARCWRPRRRRWPTRTSCNAQRSYTGRLRRRVAAATWARCSAASSSATSCPAALRGGIGGGGGGGGGWRSTTFGGSGGGGGFTGGGGGRF